MSKHDVANRVIAYRLGGDPTIRCGLAIAAEGDGVRIFEYVPVSDPSEHIMAVERDLDDENRYIASCVEKLATLQRDTSPTQLGAGTPVDAKLKQKWLQWAKDGLRRVGGRELRRMTSTPVAPSHSAVEVICSAAATIVSDEAQPTGWQRTREVFADPELVDKLCNLDITPMQQALHDLVITHFYPSPLFTLEEATKCSPALSALHKWITAYMDFEGTRLVNGTDLEMQHQKEGLHKAIEMARERREHMQEDIALSHKNMLFRRTNRIKVIPHNSIVKVVGDAPARLGREFVIKGLDKIDSGEDIAIVRRASREESVPAKVVITPVVADLADGAARAKKRWRQASYSSSSLNANSKAESPTTKVSEPRTASVSQTGALSTSVGGAGLHEPTADAPTAEPPLLTSHTAPTTSRDFLSAPAASEKEAVTQDASPACTTSRDVGKLAPPANENGPPLPSRDSAENDHLRGEVAHLQQRLERVKAAHQSQNEQSKAQFRSLQDEFFRVLGAHKELLEDFTLLRSEHEAIVEGASGLLEEKADAEQAWRKRYALAHKELLLSKAVISVLRASSSQQHGQPLPLPPPLRSCITDKSDLTLQNTLLCTLEFLRGATATMQLPMSY